MLCSLMENVCIKCRNEVPESKKGIENAKGVQFSHSPRAVTITLLCISKDIYRSNMYRGGLKKLI